MKKVRKVLLTLLLLATIVMPYNVFADSKNDLDTYIDEKASEVVSGDNLNPTYDSTESGVDVGDNFKFNKNVLGSSVVAGNDVNISGNVDGVLIGAGNAVSHDGTAEYGLLAGNTITVDGKFTKDVLVAGNIISISKNASLGRDLIVFGSKVDVSALNARNITIFADTVELSNIDVIGNAKIMAKNIVIKENVSIKGTLTYTSNSYNQIDEKASINKLNPIEAEEEENHEINNYIPRLTSYVSLLLVFAVVALTLPSIIEKLKKKDFNFMNALTYCGNGLLLLVLIPLGVLILFTLVIGIPLALIILALYLIALYMSNVFSGYYLGNYIWIKLMKKKENTLLEGLIGISVLFVLSLIPVIGVITSIISFLCGLGLIIELIKKK